MRTQSSVRLHGGAASLPQSQERFRLLVEAVEDYAIFLLDPNGIVCSWNNGAERIKGYRAEEIIGQPFTVFYPEEAIAARWPQYELEQARRIGRFEDEGWRLRKDGSRFWANVVITALYDDDGHLYGFAKITRDLSERRRHEEALRQSEERFRLLVESVRDHAIFMLDTEGRIESWNAGAEAIKGYSAQDVLGRHVSMFFTPEDIAAGQPERELKEALEKGRWQGEGWRVRKDGNLFWAAVTVSPVRDAEGRLRGYAKVTRDMSERRRLADLEHAARRMSEFLAMLAHELRNPLAPIRNAVSIMQLEPTLPSRVRSGRDIIDRQLTHLTRLVDELLDVGRIATGKIHIKRQRIGFRDVVMRSVEAARPLIESRGHTLVLDVPPSPIEMIGDDTRLNQVLQNLLINAAKYTDPGGRVEMRVRVEGDMVITTVTDNGRGIDPDALERVFQLFVQEDAQQSPTDAGLGIGLTLARTLVDLHGGSIRAASAGRNQGSTITVRLPLGKPAAGEPIHHDGARPSVPERLRVLVVDDNRDSADTMAGLLQALGHDGLAVYDGSAALEAVREFEPRIILLDLNMPGLDGYAVAQQLRRSGSTRLFIGAMTGYGQEADRQRTLEAGFDAHLTKPVGVEQLLELIEKADPKQP
jgi:PAS domain S-box-containing protein